MKEAGDKRVSFLEITTALTSEKLDMEFVCEHLREKWEEMVIKQQEVDKEAREAGPQAFIGA